MLLGSWRCSNVGSLGREGPLPRVPSPAHSKTQPPRHPSLECWRARPLWMTHAREHVLPSAPTSSRSDAIQSSAKSEALQNTAAAPPKFGVLALAPALDDARSGTRSPSRSHEFPLRRNPKLRQVGSTPKHSHPATQVWSAGARARFGRRVLGNTFSQPLPRVPAPTRSKPPARRKHSKTQPPRHPSLECWRSRPLWMTHAREHVCRAAPTCSRSDAIQSSAKSEALQNTAAAPPKFGVLALAPALDDACSGTRSPSRSHEFPFRRNPKLRQVGSTPKHSHPATQVWSAGARARFGRRVLGNTFSQPLPRVPAPTRSKPPARRKHSKTQPPRHPSLECWRSRPLWMTHAREHVCRAAPTCSRSDAIQSSAKSEALQNTAAAPPKFGVLALAPALDDACSGTRSPSRSHEFPFRRNPKLRQVGSTPKHSHPATQVWSAGARSLAPALDDACSGTRPPTSSRSGAIQGSGKPGSTPSPLLRHPAFKSSTKSRMGPLTHRV